MTLRHAPQTRIRRNRTGSQNETTLCTRLHPVVHWCCRLEVELEGDELPKCATRLTTWINRADMLQTKSALYLPAYKPITEIPETAWTLINPP